MRIGRLNHRRWAGGMSGLLTLALAMPALAQSNRSDDPDNMYDNNPGRQDRNRSPYMDDQDSIYDNRQDRSDRYQNRGNSGWDRDNSNYRSDNSQDRYEEQRFRGSRGSQQYDNRNQRYNDRNQQYGQRGQNRGQSGQRSPTGDWLYIAYDFDNDGQFDAFEYIYATDLDRARQSSRMRQQGNRSGGRQNFNPQGDRFSQQGRRPGPGSRQAMNRGRQGPRQYRISGKVQDTMNVTLYGMNKEHTVARVKTDRGDTVKVDLGPKSDLRQLDLSQGDRVTITGHRGRINDRHMLMATRVQHDGRSVNVQRQRPQSDQRLNRIRGQVVSARTVSYKGHEQDHLLTRVRTQRGDTVQVDLGPKNKLSGVNVDNGDKICVLGCRGRIGGRTALLADEFKLNDGQTRKVQHPHQKSKERKNQNRDDSMTSTR